MRRIATPNDFFNILDEIKGGQWVTIGAVVGANLNGYPTIKRKNPLTNRMKGYPDHEAFGVPEEIGALVKISSYNMHYSNRDKVSKRYGEWKNAVNSIKRDYGIPEIGDRGGYKDVNNYGNGIETYNGKNESLKGHSYAPQNIFNVKPSSLVYAINQEGHIIQALKPEQVKPYVKQYKEFNPNAPSYKDSGANALMKMGVEEEKIKEYLQKIADLKFSYMNFEANSILWIAASVNGEKIVYINDNLSRAVDGININPQDFIAIARERYQKDLNNLQEMTMKNDIRKIRLTESELKETIRESIQKILSELDWRTAKVASEKSSQHAQQAKKDGRNMEAQRRNNQAERFAKYSKDAYNKQYWIDKVRKKQKELIDKTKGLATYDNYKPTQGELKRMQQGSDDAFNFYRGGQEYKDGKWQDKVRKESKEPQKVTSETLRSLVKESAMKILSELDWRTYQSAARKNDEWRENNPNHRANQWNRSYGFRNAARDAFDKEHGLENQYDNGAYGGETGTINFDNWGDDLSVSGSRNHDFGDGDPHGLGHNVYHMAKKYGKDGNYGRTRMWDTPHETTPEEFYGDDEMGKKFRNAEQDVQDFNSGKTKYAKGRGWSNESKDGKETLQERAFKNNQGYSHFAVSKKNGKIVNGWDYKSYDPSELRQFKKDYFDADLIDYGFDPKNFRILTYKYLVRNGINPDDNSNWANNDETDSEFVG